MSYIPYSGLRNKNKEGSYKRVESMNMQDKIFDILIPEEQGSRVQKVVREKLLM